MPANTVTPSTLVFVVTCTTREGVVTYDRGGDAPEGRWAENLSEAVRFTVDQAEEAWKLADVHTAEACADEYPYQFRAAPVLEACGVLLEEATDGQLAKASLDAQRQETVSRYDIKTTRPMTDEVRLRSIRDEANASWIRAEKKRREDTKEWWA